MRLFATAAAASLLLFTTSAANAAVTMTDDEAVIVQSHEVIDDDLIVWGSYVRIDGLVQGDLVAIGKEVVVEGIVEQDLLAVGQTVYLNGQVGDDARIAAYAVALGEKARVADDLFDLGYSLESKPGSAVGGSVYAASRQAILAGQVVERLLVRAGALELRGLTGGDVQATVGGLEGFTHSEMVIDLALEIPEVPDGIALGPGATIGGDLLYRSPAEARIDADARVQGEVRRDSWHTVPGPPRASPDPEVAESPGSRLGDALERLAVLLAVGIALAVAVPGWLRARAETLRGAPAGTLGWGIGALVFGGLASLLVAVVGMTVLALGLSLGWSGLATSAVVAGFLLQTALFAGFGIAALYLGPVLASAGLGAAAMARIRPPEESASVWGVVSAVAAGAALYAVLRALPGVGWLAGLVLTLAGLGALALWLRELFVEPRP